MLMPSIFTNTYFNDFFEDPFKSLDYNTSGLMTTDVKDTKDGYEMTMNLPGVKKEDIQAELKDGYLTINAVSNSNKDEKDKDGKYIRKERYSGACSRSFYVGDAVTEEDIKGEFKHGILKLFVPKKEAKPAVEDHKYIAIEG